MVEWFIFLQNSAPKMWVWLFGDSLLVIRYWEPGTGGDLTSFLTHPPAPSLPRPSGTWQRWGVSWFNSDLIPMAPNACDASWILLLPGSAWNTPLTASIDAP